MSERFEGEMREAGGAPARLIAAVSRLWESPAGGEVSARAVAQAAELPVSSIYYHFGSLEQLFQAAHRDAVQIAGQWCARRMGEIPDTLDDRAALAPLLAAAIDGFARECRAASFAWRECQRAAARDGAYRPMLAQWDALWRSFWQTACTRCGVPDWSEATTCFFDGESLFQLMLGDRLVDRACLAETCDGWGQWVQGALAPEGPWRRHERTRARRTLPPPRTVDGTPDRIAQAAATLVAQRGAAGLTHRAVAAEAGVTLGVVSYNFRTSEELLQGAFDVIYRRAVETHVAEDEPDHWFDDPARMRDARRHRASDAAMLSLLAMDELLVHVARRSDSSPFAVQLRYLRGQTSGPILQTMLGRATSPLDGAVYSSLSLGETRAAIALDADGREALFARIHDFLIARLAAPDRKNAPVRRASIG